MYLDDSCDFFEQHGNGVGIYNIGSLVIGSDRKSQLQLLVRRFTELKIDEMIVIILVIPTIKINSV